MFFAYMTLVAVVVLFFYALWKIIVKPILESRGIEVDEEIVRLTKYEVRRHRLQDEVDCDRKDANAAEDMVDLTCEKADLDKIIDDAEKEMKK